MAINTIINQTPKLNLIKLIKLFKRSRHTQTSFAQFPFLPNPPFLPFFLWCDLLLTGSHHSPLEDHIPNMIPNLTETAKLLIIERDAIRTCSPSDPHIQELNAQIVHIKISNKQKLTQTVESFSHKCNASHLYMKYNQIA